MTTVISILPLLAVPAVISVDVSGIAQEPSRAKRLAIHPSQWRMHLWPGGVVPYEIASHYDSWEKGIILSGMAEFPKHTCITFRPRTPSDKYYLTINKHYDLERCFSYIGRQTSKIFLTKEGNIETRMRLDPSCLRSNGRGTVMHELMHIIGFYHEHQRDDRDPRVNGSATHYNYKIYPRSATYYMGKYDPTSIMHYNFPGIVYPRSYFSVSDVLRINTLYRCPLIEETTTTASPVTWARQSPVTTTTSRPTWTTTQGSVSTTAAPRHYFIIRRVWLTPTSTTRRPTPSWTTRRLLQWSNTATTVSPVSTTQPFYWQTRAAFKHNNFVHEDEQISRNNILRRL